MWKRAARLTVVVLATMTAEAAAQAAPPVALFREWARTNASTVAVRDSGGRASDFAPLGAMIGNARVVAFGEPFHGGHEPLMLRNRIIRYLVEQKHFRVVALETGLAQSKPLSDYVLGLRDVDPATLRASFTYGFGDYPENMALLVWLRSYNAGRAVRERVHLYGIDLPGQLTGPASVALTPVLAYLDRVDADLGRRTRQSFAGVVPVFDGRTFETLPAIERDRIGGLIDDLVATLGRGRIRMTAASSQHDYEWALRQAINSQQDLAFMRMAPKGVFSQMAQGGDDPLRPDPGLLPTQTIREMAMADNVAWALTQAGVDGRVVFFAHNVHMQIAPRRVAPSTPFESMVQGLEPAGMFLRAMFRNDYVAIGTAYGVSVGPPSNPESATPTAIDRVFQSPNRPGYVMDLRRVPASTPLGAWLMQPLDTRSDLGTLIVSPKRAYDVLVFINRVTPSQIGSTP